MLQEIWHDQEMDLTAEEKSFLERTRILFEEHDKAVYQKSGYEQILRDPKRESMDRQNRIEQQWREAMDRQHQNEQQDLREMLRKRIEYLQNAKSIK